jgi:hypothetical protein
MNFYTFLKFTGFLFLSSYSFCSLDPRNILISYTYGPRPVYSHGIRVIPARSVADGEEEVREKDHGSIANLGVVGVGPEVVEGGGSTAKQRWRRSSFKSDELRRARAGANGPGSFTGGRGRCVGAWPGQCGAEQCRRRGAALRR